MTAPSRLGALMGLPVFFVTALFGARQRRYNAIFGVDPLGGFCGCLTAWLVGSPFYYWSLVLFDSPATLRERVLTFMQRRACASAKKILVQDERRARVILSGNESAMERVIIVPNAPAGAPNLRRSDYLAAKLGIPPGMKIVLHAGMLDHCVLSLELARSVRKWPVSYCLVLHSNERKAPNNPLVEEIRRLQDGRVFLSLDPVPASDLDELLASAYIGLATYQKGLGVAWELLSAASGKLGSYMRSGIPVICTDQTGMREVIETDHSGLVVSDLGEIPLALETISGDYDTFRAGAFRCYLERYEFSSHFGRVLEALEQFEPVAR
jgi:glycosyltransferase involved in cell wall biosynthesis